MPESSLSLSFHDLQSEVGSFAGYGNGANFGDSAWDDLQQLRIDRSVKSGLRLVYYTREMEGIPGGYSWSFLRPTSRVFLASGANYAELPDDFGGLEANVIPASTSGESEFPIAVCGPGELYRERSLAPNSVGRPRLAMIEPKRGTTPTESTRFRLQVYPTTDQDYTLQVWYFILPDALTDALPNVYGGAAHAETFKSAVRAAYETQFDNIAGGPEWTRFVEQLRASIAYDRKLKPLTIGRNADRSDAIGLPYGWPHVHDADEIMPMLVNGTAYG